MHVPVTRHDSLDPVNCPSQYSLGNYFMQHKGAVQSLHRSAVPSARGFTFIISEAGRPLTVLNKWPL